MATPEEDLTEYWSDLRSRPTLHKAQPRDLWGSLEIAAEKTKFDLIRKHNGEDSSQQRWLSKVVGDAVKIFLDNWRTDLIALGPGAIVELILADQHLTVIELKAFVRAIPESLIKRIVDAGAASESAHGIHALMAVEYHYRVNRVRFERDYDLARDPDGTLSVTFYRVGEPSLNFRLDDTFQIAGVHP